MEAVIQKKNRILELFYRLMRGEMISVKKTAQEYGISTKSISRDITELKNFLSENRELVGNTELKYSAVQKAYYLELDYCLLSKELLLILKILLGTRALQKTELLDIAEKLKHFATRHDREMMDRLIAKEMYHYEEVKHHCESVTNLVWKLTSCIYEQKEITVFYYKMDGSHVERRLQPAAILFSEYYFYLIAYSCESKEWTPRYFRVDRITKLVVHHTSFTMDYEKRFDEGELRKKIHFMFPGESRKIRFEFTGPSVQAILDKIPTAKVIRKEKGVSLIEAETFGSGINMFLLSQGSWVKAVAPESFVEEMRQEIEKMQKLYR